MKEPNTDFLATNVPDSNTSSATDVVVDRRAALELRIATLELEVKSIRERHLRAAADLENERKRRARELDEVRRATTDDVLMEMTLVANTMGRTFQQLEQTRTPESGSVIDGLQLVSRQLTGALDRVFASRKEPR